MVLNGRRVTTLWPVIFLIVSVASATLIPTAQGLTEGIRTDTGMRPSEATEGSLLVRSEQGVFIPAPALSTDLALKHHLVSRYTSLIAVEMTPARPADQGLHTHALKTNLPEGWDYTAVFGLPQSATNWQLRSLLGLFALLLASILYRRRWQRV